MQIALYARVSKREQADDAEALERQLWQLDCAAQQIGGEVQRFVDVQSGRRDDRPEFQRLLRLIEGQQIDLVALTRIDRITRDLEMNARLAKLFERTGVRIYEILLEREINWKNPNDWEYFVRSGVKAESESRMQSARIKQTIAWHRQQGKPTGRVGWPYKIGGDGFIVPASSGDWEKAIALIKILLEENGTTHAAYQRAQSELGITKTRTWLYQWARSPLIRGHTVRDTRKQNGNKRGVNEAKTIERDTHQSLFESPELREINALQRLDRIIQQSNKQRGIKKKNNELYPLSGLLFCGRCGAPCHIKRVSSNGPQPYVYATCSQRYGKLSNCGGEYGSLAGRRGSVNTRYKDIDKAVVEALRKRAADIVKLGAEQKKLQGAETKEPPEARDLRRQIEKLEELDDTDLFEIIAAKQAKLSRILNSTTVADSIANQQLIKRLIELAETPYFWEIAEPEEKREIYQELVQEVRCDRSNIEVRLRI